YFKRNDFKGMADDRTRSRLEMGGTAPEITREEMRALEEEVAWLDKTRIEKIYDVMLQMQDDDYLSRLDFSIRKTLAAHAVSDWYAYKLEKIVQEFGQEKADLLGFSREDIWENDCASERGRLEWLDGAYLTFSPSQLNINERTGRSFASELRESVQNERYEAYQRMEEFSKRIGLKKNWVS
ncbi:hypothetical protein KBB27_03365, partial [Patescibacteria group bacterium]|nr:hypothetical protein [Patescibacteria group bacterium]